MASYRLTNKAVEDLSDIWQYTVDTWSEKQADKYYFMLLDTCKELAKKPNSGKNMTTCILIYAVIKQATISFFILLYQKI